VPPSEARDGVPKALDAVALRDAAYAPGYRGLGLVYERQGKNGAAVKMLRRYLRLAPWASDAGSIKKRISSMDS